MHNSFSKSSPFALDPTAFPDREKEDAYHFVTYLPVHGMLYELDGLRQSPVMHAAIEEGSEEGSWLDLARETIEKRIATYPAGSVGRLSCTYLDPNTLCPLSKGVILYW